MPVLQANVRAAGVVMTEHAANEDKGIANTSFLQGFVHGSTGVARTEVTILNVWMGHQVIGCSRVGLQGHDLKAQNIPFASQTIPGKLDREGAQFDVLQGNRLGGNAEELFLPVDVQITEFVLQSL